MNRIYNLLLVAITIAAINLSGFAQGYPDNQPYASYWHVEELLNWSPATDPDADFNRSGVALQGKRFENPALKVNDHAHNNEAKINNLSIFAATSGNPSQGELKAKYYAYTYWEYCDLMVLWGGSAGEGLILAPNPTIIDASHRNGVKVLGTIFLPPTAYGGYIGWVEQLVQSEGGVFPVADKLIEVAEYYGFDGWFINQETAGGDTQLANEMVAFMKYFQDNSDLELEWYDSMVESGGISWQNQLNTSNDKFFQDGETMVSEHMFLNFWWSSYGLKTSRTRAQALGRSEYDLYAGIDVQANGYNTNANWSGIFPEDEAHVTSLGFYVPSWTKDKASDYMDFFKKENEFWVGATGDPSNTSENGTWKGLAHYVASKSNITQLPFVTNFCTGNGMKFFIEGESLLSKEITTGWNNLSTQDVQPTWKWLMETEGEKLTTSLDFNDAYYGGNSLKVSGNLAADNQLKLFATQLQVSPTTVCEIIYKPSKVGATNMQIGLSYYDDPTNYEFTEVGNAETADWNSFKFDLSAHENDTIASVCLKFTAGGGADYSMNIGRFAIYNGTIDIPAVVSNVTIVDKAEKDNKVTSVRLKWDAVSDDVYYYNVYRESGDSLIYLGSTPNNAYFVPAIFKEGAETSTNLVVETVNTEFGHSTLSTPITFDWIQGPEQAYEPAPADGAVDVATDLFYVTWKAGSGTESFDVYFGKTNPPEFIGNQTAKHLIMESSLDTMTTYYWRVDGINSLGTTEGKVWSFKTNNIPTSIADFGAKKLNLNHYPNPFNQSVEITYEIQKTTAVTIDIYNISGMLVKRLMNQQQGKGNYSISWDGTNSNGNVVQSGTYIYQFRTDDAIIVNKLIKY